MLSHVLSLLILMGTKDGKGQGGDCVLDASVILTLQPEGIKFVSL